MGTRLANEHKLVNSALYGIKAKLCNQIAYACIIGETLAKLSDKANVSLTSSITT